MPGAVPRQLAHSEICCADAPFLKAQAHFLVPRTPTALERCGDPDDWMRREIETALDSKRNIVPLMLEGFDFSRPAIANSLLKSL
jgi:hypothetical protein